MDTGNNKKYELAKQPKSSKKLIIFLDIFLVVAVISLVVLWMDSRTPLPTYEIHEVKKGTIENKTLATGKISPRNMVSVKPQISGIISELKKEPGDSVKVGDILAVINVVPEMTSLNAAQARLEMAQINMRLMKDEYDRQLSLYESKVVSRQEMLRVETEYKKAHAELVNARDNLSIVRSGVSASTGGHTQVRSTIDGTILNIPVKVGSSVIQSNTFNDGTTIATVADMNDMLFIGNIDESEIDKVYVGMPVSVSIGALKQQTFNAVLEYIAPQGMEINGAILFEIKATVNIPPDVTIRSGYSANAEMILEKSKDVLMVPEGALYAEGDQYFVYLCYIDDEGNTIYVKQYVTLGLSDGVYVEINGKNIREGDKIRGNILSK